MAVTVVNTLYPPLIETFQPAFIYTKSVSITFSLSPFNAASDIQSVHVSVVDQRNNSNVLKTQIDAFIQSEDTKQLYGGIINGIFIADFPEFNYDDTDKQRIGLFQYDPVNDIYAIDISPNLLDKPENYWNNNQYYQVQIRFDRCDNTIWHTEENVDPTYILGKREYFSEWSSITLIKPIIQPIISIFQLDNTILNNTYPGSFHISGCLAFDYDESKNNGISYPETERLQAYRIIATVSDNLIDDSGWIYARQNLLNTENTVIDYLLDLMNTRIGDDVSVTIYCRTNNGYICKEEYTLKIQGYATPFSDIKWNSWSTLIDTEEKRNTIDINQEDGIALINFSAHCNTSGIIYFKRACSKDNFKTWELIYRYDINEAQDVNIPFEDYTISSLYEYQYSAQMCTINKSTKKEIWGELVYSNRIYPIFYEMLLMRQNRQIAIRYNGQISSWKPTVNRQKIDTLGGRYPKFVENAAMNYKTYQISGLISAEEDFNRKFLSELEDINVQNYDIEFNTEYLIRNDTAADGEILYTQKNLPENTGGTKKGKQLYEQENGFSGELNNQHDSYPHNHWYWEREFREQLVAWLNDGEPKLYRSMPEGNIAVMLTDINLTPDSQLGRMLYNFSATMYEIGNGYSLDELDNLKIIEIPKPDAIFLTDSNFSSDDSEDSDEDLEDTEIGQITLSTNNRISNWISGTTNNHNTSDLWNDMSLYERLSERYAGIQNNEKTIVDSSIRLSNIDLYFNSSPQYFTYTQDDGFQPSNNTTEWLGYVIKIKEKGKTDAKAEEIFINQKGFYHIPDTINVQDIQILTGNQDQEITISYQYQYKLKDTNNASTADTTILGDIIGQYTRDVLPLDTDIIPLIYQDYEQITYKNGQINTEIKLDNCKGLMLDITPYTYIKYLEQKDDNEHFLVIGHTGIFNAFDEWDITSLTILGRRMTILNNYPYQIEEWQCYQDSNDNINNPKINGIYGNKIYYIDGKWYPVTLDTTNNLAIAKVPIYGMINYHGDLIKVVH